MVELLEEEIGKLTDDLEETKADFLGLLEIAESERDRERARADNLRSHVDISRSTIEKNKKTRSNQQVNPAIPCKFSGIEKWSDNHLSGFVVLLGRAIREAEDAKFSEPRLICEILLALKNVYVPMKRYGGEHKQAWREFLDHHRIEDVQRFQEIGGVRTKMSTS